jgi:hypothetical protein
MASIEASASRKQNDKRALQALIVSLIGLIDREDSAFANLRLLAE